MARDWPELGAPSRRRINLLEPYGHSSSSAPRRGPIALAMRSSPTGALAPDRRVNRLERLTPLELDVALAAGAGAPLDDIAHGLFLGPRSVRLLQASAMAKLGVESTAELVAALGPEMSPDARVAGQAGA